MQKSMIDTIGDLRNFVNRKECPASHLGFYLGKPRSSHLFGAMRVKPFDTRFNSILVNMKPQNFNIVRFLVFNFPENPVGLADLEAKFGPFIATWNEEKKITTLECKSFAETEMMEAIVANIEGYHMENAEGGLMLDHDGKKVLVPTSEILLPELTFLCREFERPPDRGGKNPIFS